MTINPGSFERAFEYLMRNEGLYIDHPNDHGGPTKYGITQSTLSRYRTKPVSVKDVQDLSREEARMIYYRWYWMPLDCMFIKSLPIAVALFDMGVLFGIYQSACAAQTALNILNGENAPLKIDGQIGPKTLAALNSADTNQFLKHFALRFKSRIADIIEAKPNQMAFKKGWESRVERLEKLIG